MEIYPEIDLESKEWKTRFIPGQCMNSWIDRTA